MPTPTADANIPVDAAGDALSANNQTALLMGDFGVTSALDKSIPAAASSKLQSQQQVSTSEEQSPGALRAEREHRCSAQAFGLHVLRGVTERGLRWSRGPKRT